ncbi:unnamed protein product, partial [Mesorhabditis spiculigera]
MDIEYDVTCNHDELKLLEGAGDQAQVVHRYCIPAEKTALIGPNSERFNTQISKSRHFTLIWRTDADVEQKGWKLEYEFVNPNSECGFISNAMHGVIYTPNYPDTYDNDLGCIWDISVPQGYHIQLDFETFDVQSSQDCQADFLQVYEEHQGQEWAPQGDYYFLFNNEEAGKAMCGIDIPKPYESESNRIRYVSLGSVEM